MTIKDEPAFPIFTTHGAEDQFGHNYTAVEPIGGLTKREWFAGMALQGIMANPAYLVSVEKNTSVKTDEDLLRNICGQCFKLSDAMLKASASNGEKNV